MNQTFKYFSTYLYAIVSLSIFILPPPHSLFAQGTTTWIGGVGDWNNDTNWDNGLPDSATSNIFITNNGLATVSGPFDLTTGSLSIGTEDGMGELVIDGNGANATLRCVTIDVGFDPTGSSRLSVLSGGNLLSSNGLFINGNVDIAGRLGGLDLSITGGHTTVRDGGLLVAGVANTRIGSDSSQVRLDVVDNGVANLNSTRSTLYIGPGGNVEFGASSLVVLANGGHLEAFGSVLVEAGGELRFGDGESAGSVSTDLIQNDNLIRLRHIGTLNLNTRIIGNGRILSDDVGSTVFTRLDQFEGVVHADRGEIVLVGNVQDVDTLHAGSDGRITYRNANVRGGFMRGAGVHELAAAATSTLTNLTSFSSTQIDQHGMATLRNFSNGGLLRNFNDLELDGFSNRDSGRLEVSSHVRALDLSSSGNINVHSGGMLQIMDSDFVAGGGSRTYVHEGGLVSLANDYSMELNGGLLVNNGEISGTLNVNFGSLAKGAGVFGEVNINDGGRFSPGNSPDLVTLQSLTVNGGSILEFEVQDMLGAVGEDFDQVHILDQLVLSPGNTELSQITISIQSLGFDNLLGLAENFDVNGTYSFDFLVADGGINGFDPSRIRIDSSRFLNAPNASAFWVSANGNRFSLNYSAVPEPSTIALLGAVVLAIALAGRRRNPALQP